MANSKDNAAAEEIVSRILGSRSAPTGKRGKALLGSAGRLAVRVRPGVSTSSDDDDLPRPWDGPEWGGSPDTEAEKPQAKPRKKPRPQTSAERVERLIRQPRKRT